MVSPTGTWSGKIAGTNNGDIAVEIVEADRLLSGVMRINDLQHGVATYDFEGRRNDSTLRLKGVCRPDQQPSRNVFVHRQSLFVEPPVLHGEVTVEGHIAGGNRITGDWSSSIGTAGTFWVQRAMEHDHLNTNKVFLIHGRDGDTKNTVARFLEKLGLEAVVLHEQPNAGRTIIEKFEDYARVEFVVVLLTPDDRGGLQDDDILKPRARQNVILELGYFLGKLGRERVCALVKEGVEWPSDYNGVLYIPLDEFDGWKGKLVRELRHAGYDIDANDAL